MSARGNIYDVVASYTTRINSSGRATGQLDPDSLGVGPTLSPAFMLRGPMTLKAAKAARASVEFRGAGTPEGKRPAGIDSIGDAELQMSQWDSGLDPIINGGLVDTTSLSGAEISSPNNINPSPNVLALCNIVRVDRRDSLNRVDYLHLLYPNCTMSRQTPDMQQVDGNQKNPSPVTAVITPSVATKFPNGVAFGANQAWYRNSEFEFYMTSQYPYFMDVWVADGSATTFTLTYLPKYSGVGTGNTNNWVTKNGTPTAPTSINTSTGLVTIASAGSAGDLWIVWYPVEARLLI